MLEKRNTNKSNPKLFLLWDLFMILTVLVNLVLIIFDLTYFELRPFYFIEAPKITNLYDPFKGVEPNPITEEYLKQVKTLKLVFYSNQPQDLKRFRLSEVQQELAKSWSKIRQENPFEKAGLTGNLERIKFIVRNEYTEQFPSTTPVPTDLAFAWFWSINPENAGKRFRVFDAELKPLFSVNYHRRYDLDGDYIDKFYWIDTPFVILFLLEFFIRWYLSVKRKEYSAWFLFPIYKWYDIAGLIPLAEFRFLRLIRIISVYVRLQKSSLTKIGEDFISNWVKHYTNILKEELSDMVTIRILSEMQEEIKSGASIDIFIAAIEENRQEIKSVLLSIIREAAHRAMDKDKVRDLLEEALLESTSRVNSLLFVPDPIKKTLTKEIGLSIYDAFQNTIVERVKTENEIAHLEDILDAILDQIIYGASHSNFQKLADHISLQVLENLKKQVSIKRWALEKESNTHTGTESV